MVGNCADKYFRDISDYEVWTTDQRFPSEEFFCFVRAFLMREGEKYILNCIGKIPQKTDNFEENWTIPEYLSSLEDVKIIEISTDCVFQCTKDFGIGYNSNDPRDADSAYGISKIKGEDVLFASKKADYKIFRQSIIGLEINSASGLLSWYLANRGKQEIKGLTEHYWNGITSLSLCQVIDSIIRIYGWNMYPTVVQTGTKDVYSKYDMLNLFERVFGDQSIKIGINQDGYCNRVLFSDIYAPSLYRQLHALKEFYNY